MLKPWKLSTYYLTISYVFTLVPLTAINNWFIDVILFPVGYNPVHEFNIPRATNHGIVLCTFTYVLKSHVIIVFWINLCNTRDIGSTAFVGAFCWPFVLTHHVATPSSRSTVFFQFIDLLYSFFEHDVCVISPFCLWLLPTSLVIVFLWL